MQLIIVVLGFVIMGKVVMGYQASQEVLGSTDYQHSLETIRLWQKGIVSAIKVT
jgi:hypothetical protein